MQQLEQTSKADNSFPPVVAASSAGIALYGRRIVHAAYT